MNYVWTNAAAVDLHGEDKARTRPRAGAAAGPLERLEESAAAHAR